MGTGAILFLCTNIDSRGFSNKPLGLLQLAIDGFDDGLAELLAMRNMHCRSFSVFSVGRAHFIHEILSVMSSRFSESKNHSYRHRLQ